MTVYSNGTKPYEQSVQRQTENLFRQVMLRMKPPPNLTLSQWADAYRYLSSESSAEPGRWRTDRAPYQREPMNAISDVHVKKVVLMWAAQMGKTDCAILNTVGFYMHLEPCPIMLLQPTVEMAETVSKNRINPMLRDTPILAELFAQKSRDKNNTIQEKQFPGGYLVMQGANSPAALASRPVRVLMMDEVDRYPITAGKEGDPVMLAHKRTTAFWNSKEVVTSTPTNKGQSRIETEYEHSTQEVWNVPCPVCGKYQPLTWAKIKFDAEQFREGINRIVRCECEFCGAVSEEYEWKQAGQRGKYIATYPTRKVRGFFVNALSSTFTTWEEITEDFLTAIDERDKGNIQLLKTWTNTALAETWDETGVSLEQDNLKERAEAYTAEVPEGVLYLTCGVDTQDDRFEFEVVGWGIGAESWGIIKGAIYGDLKGTDIWERLDEQLLKTFHKGDGTIMSITATCIDSQGHHALQVYRFCKDRWARNVWAIKGKGGMDVPYISNPTKNNRASAPLFILGVDTGKCLVYDRLQVSNPGPGYCHFPIGRGYDDLYYKGLTAEKLVMTYKQGVATRKWVLKDLGFRRNEPLDIRDYAQAAVEIANLPLWPKEKKRPTRRGRRQISRGIGED